MNTDALAFELLAELQRRSGSVGIDQVDFVLCEDDGASVMGFFYAPSGECTPICFDTPAHFDPDELRSALMGSGAVH
jgi:hypothetical protein